LNRALCMASLSTCALLCAGASTWGAPESSPQEQNLAFFFRAPVPFQTSLRTDLDGDGRVETIRVDSRRKETVQVLHGIRKVWGGVWRQSRPWSLAVGDVDGDGRREVALGLFKGTRLWPRPHRTVSFYAWKGRVATRKFSASRLTLPMREFFLLNVDADRADEMLAVERGKDGRWSLATYKWNYFGFDLTARQGAWNSVQVLAVNPARRIARLRADGREFTVPAAKKHDSVRHGR
jgi:hypothetical protein